MNAINLLEMLDISSLLFVNVKNEKLCPFCKETDIFSPDFLRQPSNVSFIPYIISNLEIKSWRELASRIRSPFKNFDQ